MIRFYQPKGLVISALLFFALLFLAACSSTANLDEPPEIQYGQDVCDECNMIISEPRFAASYVTPDGQVRRFGDIGDMLAYLHKNDEEVFIYWVHDLYTEEWLDASQASYILNPDLITPMGWGLAAFSSQADARSYVNDNGGKLTTWSDLLEAVETGALDPSALAGQIHTQTMDQSGEGGMAMDDNQESSGTVGDQE